MLTVGPVYGNGPGTSTSRRANSSSTEKSRGKGKTGTDVSTVEKDVPPCIGLLIENTFDMGNLLRRARLQRFEFICTLMKGDQVIKNLLNLQPRKWETEICTLPTNRRTIDFQKDIVVVLPDVENCFHSDDLDLLENSKCILQVQIQDSLDKNMAAIIIQIKNPECEELIKFVFPMIERGNTTLWVQLPMVAYPYMDNEKRYRIVVDPWIVWRKIRNICGSSPKVGICLKMCNVSAIQEHVTNRWFGESIRCLFLDTSLFIVRKDNRLELDGVHLKIVKSALNVEASLCVSTNTMRDDLWQYKDYLEEVNVSMEREKHRRVMEHCRNNYVLYPIEPLKENLSNIDYAEFEKDSIKYNLYEDAIYSALKDLISRPLPPLIINVVVAGAGMRGPLVDSTLRASYRLSIDFRVRIHAVERNVTTSYSLFLCNVTKWKDRNVKVYITDMRRWTPPRCIKVDLVVSELLGSFGDNELSPECLNACQRFLKPDGIIIPQEYSSYVQPIMCLDAWQLLNQKAIYNKVPESVYGRVYVVYQKGVYHITEPQKLATFKHPNKHLGPDFVDRRQLKFSRKFTVTNQHATLHGFLGYFSAKLYGNVYMSTLPATHSPNMISWYPAMVPLKLPIDVNLGDEIILKFWRKHDTKRVWYEWCLSSPESTNKHNLNGKDYCYWQ